MCVARSEVPSWSAVRVRYWKNQAYLHPESYKYQELARMKKGLAPQQFNPKIDQWESKELRHNLSPREGGLFDFIEVWPEEHEIIDPLRRTGR